MIDALDGLTFDYIARLLAEQQRPMTVAEIAEELEFPDTAVGRVADRAHKAGLLVRADGGYALPGAGR